MSLTLDTRWLLLLAVSATVACGQSNEVPEARRAAADVHASFLDVKADGGLITLSNEALSKSFLLTGTMVAAANAPILDHLQPKVVAFEKSGDEIALFELNTSAIYDSLPSSKLLQTFPITAQDANGVTFKWTYGLRVISLKSPMAVSDMPATLEQMVAETESVLPTVASFVRRAEFQNNTLELEQVSRVHLQGLSIDIGSILAGRAMPVDQQEMTVMLTTRLTPYQINPRFTARPSTLQKGVGFFETAQLRKNDGVMDVLATRWDLSDAAGPLTYAISRETPKDVVDAVRDGILYWNRVLGRTVLRVETDVDPREKPMPRRVLVHWIPWRLAGFSRASLEADPITGEIIGANVYLTSAFEYIGAMRMRQATPIRVETLGEHTVTALAPAGLESAVRCGFADAAHVDALADVAALQADAPGRVQVAVNDYLRTIVAHEVGHTLGLRHNFAGSLMTEAPTAAAQTRAWQTYIGDPQSTGLVTSSTVMDYMSGRDSFLLGAAMKSQALSYDRAAMSWGYLAKAVSVDSLKAPLFCTDMEAWGTTTMGCRPFDSGRNSIDGYAETLAEQRAGIPQRLLDMVLSGIRPVDKRDARTVREMIGAMDPKALAVSATQDALQTFSEMSERARVLLVDRRMGGQDWLNETAYRLDMRQTQSAAIEATHGLPGFLETVYRTNNAAGFERGLLAQAMQQKLAQPGWCTGKTLEGTAFSLTRDEIAQIREYLPKLAAAFEDQYLRGLLMAMSGDNPMLLLTDGRDPWAPLLKLLGLGKPVAWADGVVADSWQKELGAIAEKIILDTEGTISGAVNGKTIQVPSAKYPQGVRLAAVGLYRRNVFKRDNWLHDSTLRVTVALAGRITALQLDPNGKNQTLSAEIEAWALDEVAIFSALRAATSPEQGDAAL